MKVFKNTVLTGYDGKPIKLPFRENEEDKLEFKEAKLDFVLRIILNNAPISTQNDSIQGMRLAQALDEVKEKKAKAIVLEDGVHDWLKPIAEKLTPQLFRVNGSIVYEHIKEGFEKVQQPAEKEKEKEEKAS